LRKSIHTQDFSGGLVINKLPHKLSDNQTPSALNMLPFDKLGIMMRTGQKYIQKSPSNGAIYNMRQFEGFLFFAARTTSNAHGLYYTNLSAASPTYTKIRSLTGTGKGAFFDFDGALFFLNGKEYIKITVSGSTVAAAPVSGYVPLAFVNCDPDGTGYTAVESFNMLTNMYRIHYIPDGTKTAFVLPNTVNTENLGKIKAYSLYPERTQITAFTAETTSKGKTTVTFDEAPDSFDYYMGGNTLEIIAPDDTFEADAAKVTGCMFAEEFGGSLGGLTSGTRVFITGNKKYPGSVWWSGVASSDYNAAEYFPDVNVEIIGDGSKPVTAMAKMYNELIVFKERSIHGITYVSSGASSSFSVREINGYVGCDMPHTVKLINNQLCFSNTYAGVHLLISTQNNDERNVAPISANINQPSEISDEVVGLLMNPAATLRSAVAMDDGRRYWLCVPPYVYVWDYGVASYEAYSDTEKAQNRLSWWMLDNFNAGCIEKVNGVVTYGSSQKMDFVVPSSDYTDFGTRINAYYKTRGYDGGDPTTWKNFNQIRFSQKTTDVGQAAFTYIADKLDIVGETTTSKTFDLAKFAFDSFSFETVNYGDIHAIYPRLSNTAYFAWMVRNGEAGADLFITDVVTTFFVQHADY